MEPLLRGLLVDGVDPSTVPVDSLLRALGRSKDHASKRAAYKRFDVLQVADALSPVATAALCRAVDLDRRLDADSVDGLPEHQLVLTRESLAQLVTEPECERLMRLPAEYLRRERLEGGSTEEVDESVAARFSQLRECFIRRYSADTRPFNPFHQDSSRLTVNVALSSDAAHAGGRLLGVYGGAVHTLERRAGEATVHSSELIHGVTRMTGGVRYSLILFFDPMPRVVRKDGQVEDRWANRRWVAPNKGGRWWED